MGLALGVHGVPVQLVGFGARAAGCGCPGAREGVASMRDRLWPILLLGFVGFLVAGVVNAAVLPVAGATFGAVGAGLVGFVCVAAGIAAGVVVGARRRPR